MVERIYKKQVRKMRKRSRGIRQWPRMTPEQQQLAADNHDLIYGFLRMRGLDVDEWYGTAAIGLCKAAITYAPGKCTFATYAYKCMRMEAIKERHRSGAAFRNPAGGIFSLNDKAPGADCDTLERMDTIGYETDFSGPEADDIMEAVPEKYRADIRKCMNGYTRAEVSASHGHSKAAYLSAMTTVKRHLMQSGCLE